MFLSLLLINSIFGCKVTKKILKSFINKEKSGFSRRKSKNYGWFACRDYLHCRSFRWSCHCRRNMEGNRLREEIKWPTLSMHIQNLPNCKTIREISAIFDAFSALLTYFCIIFAVFLTIFTALFTIITAIFTVFLRLLSPLSPFCHPFCHHLTFCI